jgi:hypothetical protein
MRFRLAGSGPQLGASTRDSAISVTVWQARSMPATYDDANLVVQLLRWGAEMDLPSAIGQVLSDDYDSDLANANDPAVRTLLHFGETVGTFVKQGILDRGLVEDLWWIEGLWARVGPAAIRERKKMGEPRLYENFEALATNR